LHSVVTGPFRKLIKMGLLSKHRKIPADFREITLLDILNKLEKEHFFNPEQSIQLVKKVDANHLIFSVAQTKVTPAQLHEFKYLEKEKVMSIKSTYQNYFFPSILMYMLPLTAIFFDEGSFAEKWENNIHRNYCIYSIFWVYFFERIFKRDRKRNSNSIELPFKRKRIQFKVIKKEHSSIQKIKLCSFLKNRY